VLRTLLTGLEMGESPRWHDGRLWLSDWIARKLLAVDADGRPEIVAEVDSSPFCFDWTPAGELLVVAGGDAALLRQAPDASLVPHVDLSGLSTHPWNEIVVDPRGQAYVNNIGYDMMGGAEPTTGIIALVTPHGTARQVADDVAFPNGMAVTPDGSTLLVAESHAGRLTAFDIEADGGLSNRRIWAEVDGAAPDGICLDGDGAAWYADVPNKRCVRVREGGEVLAIVEVDRGCFACMLGGDDGTTLFIVANEWGGSDVVRDGAPTGQVLTVEAPAPHAGRP
jgi:sugar lactone lactonase YvrE